MENQLIKTVDISALNQPIEDETAMTYVTKNKFNTLNRNVFIKWGSFIFAVIFFFVAVISEESLSIVPVLLLVVLGFVFRNKAKKQRIVEAKRILRQHQLADDNHWNYTARMDGNDGLKGSKFKADDYNMHGLTDYFQTPKFSFGTYGYATTSSGPDGLAGDLGKTMGIIIIPLHYHFPNNVYIINKSVYTDFPLVNRDNLASFKDRDTGELKRQKVQQVNVNPEFDEIYHTYLKDVSHDAFLHRITEDIVQTMTHLKYQYDIEVIHDEICIYRTSHLNTYDFKLYEKDDLTEVLELIWQMARIFQIGNILNSNHN